MINYKLGEHPAPSRIKSLQETMLKHGIDWYIVYTSDAHLSEYTQQTDEFRAYLSGFTGSYGDLLVSQDDAWLWTDSRYYLQADTELSQSGITVMKWGAENVPDLDDFLRTHAKPNDTIGLDGRTLSYNEFDRMKKSFTFDVSFMPEIHLSDEVWTDRPKRIFNEVRIVSDTASGQSRCDKIAYVRNKLEEIHADYILFTDLCDIMWLLNIRGNDIPYVPVAFSFCVVSKENVSLFIHMDSVSETIRKELSDNHIVLFDYTEIDDFICNISNKKFAVDADKVNAQLLTEIIRNNQAFRVHNYQFVPKHIKNTAEIASMQKHHITDGISMVRFIRRIKEIVQTESIDEYETGKLLDSIRLSGDECEDLSFDTICGYEQNGAIVHYSAQKGECLNLEPHGFLLVDSGGQYPGATTDITRTIVLGPLSEEQKRNYTIVLKGNLRLLSAVFVPGVKGENLDILAHGPLWEAGLDYQHGTGHGVGANLSVHEGPVSVRTSIRTHRESLMFVPGMILSDEPGVYISGKYGIRLENMILCVDKSLPHMKRYGFDSLTLVPFEKEAIMASLLDEKELSVLNQYHKTVYEKLSPCLNEEERMWLKDATEMVTR